MEERMIAAEDKIKLLETNGSSTLALQVSLERSMKSIAKSLEGGRLFQQKVELRHIVSEEKNQDFRAEVREHFKNIEEQSKETYTTIFKILRSEKKLRYACERKCDVMQERVDRVILDVNEVELEVDKVSGKVDTEVSKIHKRVSDGNKDDKIAWRHVVLGTILGSILLVVGFFAKGGSGGIP